MALQLAAPGDIIVQSSPLDVIGADVTVVGRARLGPAPVSGGEYRTLLEFYDVGFSSYVWVGELDIGGGSVYLRLWTTGTTATDDNRGFFEVPYNQWFGWAYRYTRSTGYHELWVETAGGFEKVTAIHNPLPTAIDEERGLTSDGGATADSLVGYQRRFSRRLTIPEMWAEVTSTTVVDPTALEYDTPFTSDALDISGNGADWAITGTASYSAQPTVVPATVQTPAASLKVSSFVKAAGASQTVSGLGFTPGGLMFYSTLRQATGFETADQRQVFGVSDGVHHRAKCHASKRGSADTSHGYVTDACIIVVELDDSTSLKGHVSATSNGTFTITWDTDTGAHDGAIIDFIAWSTVHNCVVSDFTPQNSSNQLVTLSNSPDLIFFLPTIGSGGFPNTGGGFGPCGFGWTTKTAQGCSSNDHALGGGNPRLSYQRTDRCVAAKGFASAHIEGRRVSLSGTSLRMDFTIDFNAYPVFYLSIENIAAQAIALTAPGTNGSTTVEFDGRPLATILMSIGQAASTSTYSEDELSFGAADRAGNQRATWSCARDGFGTTARYQSSSVTLVTGNKAAGSETTQETAASVTSDVDTIDVDWTITNADTPQVLALVMGMPYTAASIAPEDGTAGELVTVELVDRDGTVHGFAETDLNDPVDYYDGHKKPYLSSDGGVVITRGLSDYQGNIQHPTYSVTLADPTNLLRALSDGATTKYLWGSPLVVRTVSDEDRRAQLPMHLEMVGTVTKFGPSPGLRFTFTGSDLTRRRLARKTTDPEAWVPVLSRAAFPLLPAALINKMAQLVYGKVSDAYDGVTPDPGVYPRDSQDPGWLSLGYNHLSPVTGPVAGSYVLYVTVIIAGKESTKIPFPVGFALDGSQQAYAYFSTVTEPYRYRVYFSDDDFHPVLNPLGGTFARYQDYDPTIGSGSWTDGAKVLDTDPFGNPNTENKRFILIDAGVDPTTWGNDYHAIAGTGGAVVIAPTGACPTIYCGEETYGGKTRSVFLASRGALQAIDQVYIGGVETTTFGSATELEVPGKGDYATVFGANYRDLAARRYTIIYATGQTALNAINGSAPITFNARGVETVGDGSGDLITSPVQILKHFERNFIHADAAAADTLWLTSAPDLPGTDGVPSQDDASYTQADADFAARVGGGYEVGGIIGAGGETVSAATVYAALLTAGDFERGTNRKGQTIVSVEPIAAPSSSGVIRATEVLHIVDRTFAIDADQERNFWNVIPFRHTRDYTGRTDEGYYLKGESRDAASITNYDQVRTSGVIDFWFLRGNTNQGGDTIVDVVQRKRTRWRHPRRVVTLEAPYMAVQGIELGSVLRIDHAEGTGASGWIGRDVRVTGLTLDLRAHKYRIEGYDLQPVYDGLEDAVEATQESTGLREDQTLVELQNNVQDSAVDLSGVQAEITNLDARLQDLEDGILEFRTADPGTLANGMMWGFVDGATPANFSIRIRRSGVTYDFPIGTLV